MENTVTTQRAERRAVPMQNVEIRAAAEGSSSPGTVVGYAAVYGLPSDDLGGWREVIAPGAFTEVLASDPDVRFMFDHEGMPLGRSTAGTLRLSEDSGGLRFENDLPDTERARELVAALERGDVNQCSFRFVVDYEDREWIFPDDDLPLRQVNRVKELWDACVVTFPAYPQATAGMRSLDDGCPEEIPTDPQILADLDVRRRLLALRDRA